MDYREENGDALLRLQQEIAELQEQLCRQELVSENLAKDNEELRLGRYRNLDLESFWGQAESSSPSSSIIEDGLKREENGDALLRLQQEIVELQEQLRRGELVSENLAKDNEELRFALYKADAKCYKTFEQPQGPTPCGELSPGGTTIKLQGEDYEEEPLRRRRGQWAVAASQTYEEGKTALHLAAEDGDVERIQVLLGKGLDTRARDQHGRTPLHCALVHWEEAAAEILASVDGKIDIPDGDGSTPLHHAAEKGYVGTIRKLLAAGADVRLKDQHKQTPLHCALFRGTEAAAEILVGVDSLNNIPDEDECTPLHLAARQGFAWIIKKLLTSGADVHIKDQHGRTPLHYTLFYCKDAAFEILADADHKSDIPDADGKTPLHYAAEKGCVGSIEKLLAAGADVCLKDQQGQTPLHRALLRGREAAAEILASVVDQNTIPDKNGRTPLHFAAKEGYVQVSRKLLLGGAHPHEKDRFGKYPFSLALREGHYDVARMILASCALLNISIDWTSMNLLPKMIEQGTRTLTECKDEIGRMRDTRIPESRITLYDVAQRRPYRIAPYLSVESIGLVEQDNCLLTEFPIYGDLIDSKLRQVQKRRALTDRCFECFCRMTPPLPSLCVDFILLCLPDDDHLLNFLLAVEPRPSSKDLCPV